MPGALKTGGFSDIVDRQIGLRRDMRQGCLIGQRRAPQSSGVAGNPHHQAVRWTSL